MSIDYKKANIADAPLLIKLYNAAFYNDYCKYGECPAYGRSKEEMETITLVVCACSPSTRERESEHMHLFIYKPYALIGKKSH